MSPKIVRNKSEGGVTTWMEDGKWADEGRVCLHEKGTEAVGEVPRLENCGEVPHSREMFCPACLVQVAAEKDMASCMAWEGSACVSRQGSGLGGVMG